jgi:TonB family protein
MLYLGISYARLRARRRGWGVAAVDGHEVLVSPGTGPAVVGIRRGRIVLPEWVLAADEPTRRLVLAHEAEHVAAGDARLFAAALGALVLTPWSPGAWWQVRRLRQATELDCDARVLDRHGDLRRYARLLLEVGARGGEASLVAAFAAPRSLLGRRIEALTASVPADRRRRALAAAAGAAVLLAAACLGPEPDRPMPTEAVGRARVAGPAMDALSYPRTASTDTPAYAPFTKKPELANREEVVRRLAEVYPPLLRDAGVGGRAIVSVHVDEAGRVIGARIATGSGHAPLDQAALRVAEAMRFTPAENEGRPVAVWIQLPVAFNPGAPAPAPAPAPAAGPSPSRS